MGNKIDMCAYAYMEYYRSNFGKYRWSSDYSETLIRSAPFQGLRHVAELLMLCRNNEEVVFIATGLLEDLLFQHLNVLESALKDMVHQDKIMKTALQYVWAPEDVELNAFLKCLNIQTLLNVEPKGGCLRTSQSHQEE